MKIEQKLGMERDRWALNAFYALLGGPSWERSDNWLSALPLDQWYGITTDRNGLVEGINLSFNNLKGASSKLCLITGYMQLIIACLSSFVPHLF